MNANAKTDMVASADTARDLYEADEYAIETGIPSSRFPSAPPWTIEEALEARPEMSKRKATNG